MKSEKVRIVAFVHARKLASSFFLGGGQIQEEESFGKETWCLVLEIQCIEISILILRAEFLWRSWKKDYL